jgi:cob(I)alamin adenosyltransferase
MKLYTGTGDKGKSSFLSGERVRKNHPQMQAYGEMDELNASIGVLIAALPNGVAPLGSQLVQVQRDLFTAGAWLASTAGASITKRLTALTAVEVERLEAQIDQMGTALPELRSFILPGGHPAAAQAHVARTICRRVERHVVGLLDQLPEETDYTTEIHRIQVYLNRLSDYLFVLARRCNQVAGLSDVTWQG